MSTWWAKLQPASQPLSYWIIEASGGKLRCSSAKLNTTVQIRTNTGRAPNHVLSCRLSFRPMRISLASSTVLLLTGTLALAQPPSSTQTSLALMPVPSSITRGDGTFTLTPAGGGPSTFTYNYGQTHDARLEAAIRRDVVRLGRTWGEKGRGSASNTPLPARASLIFN